MANDTRSTTPTGVGAKPWIKMRTDLWDDPRVSALCDTLETDEARVIGGLYRLWSIADAHSTDGELIGLTMPSVDRKCGIPGLARALESVNWLTIHESGVTIPDFVVHNGQSAKTRAQNSLRQQARRAKKSCNSDVSRTKRDTNASPTRQPCVSGMTREDELREEETNSKSPPPPTNKTSDTPPPNAPAGDADEWGAVEEGLISSGVSHWRGLLDSFREAACSAEHGLALIEYWEKHRDRFDSPVGALHHRLMNAHPSIPVDEGWPGLQAGAKPKRAADFQIELLTARWCQTDKPRRHEIAKLAGVELAGNDGQGLKNLPNEIRKPIVAFLSQLDARQAEKSNEA